jgi:hypothetical protein
MINETAYIPAPALELSLLRGGWEEATVPAHKHGRDRTNRLQNAMECLERDPSTASDVTWVCNCLHWIFVCPNNNRTTKHFHQIAILL